MAKVCLIRPPMFDLRYRATTVTCPPIGLAYVAGSAHAAGHEVVVIDAVGEAPDQVVPTGDGTFTTRGLTGDQIIERIPPDSDVLAVSCMFSQDWPNLRDLLLRVRARFPGVAIVGGGEHVTALPEFCIGEGALDHCVLGEGEQAFVELLDAFDAGRPIDTVGGLVTRSGGAIVRTPPPRRIVEVDAMAPPLWDAFPLENYLAGGHSFGVNRGRTMPVLASRGCPYQCTFCSSPEMWTTRYITRDPAAVLDEMRGYIDKYGAQNFDFYDLTAIIKREWILEFCQRIVDSGLQFTWQLPTGTRVEVIDEEVVQMLARTGCRNITYAPESGSQDELKRIKKKMQIDRMKSSMRSCVRHGINVKTNIVLGFPGATRRDLLNTLSFLVQIAGIGVRDALVYLFCPYPGSQMYRELRAAGKLPEPGDEYFTSLLTYTDLSHGVSWAENFTGRQLAATRVLAMVLFYTVSYLVRPWRVVETLAHIARGRHESPLERSLTDFARRFLPGNRRPESAAAVD